MKRFAKLADVRLKPMTGEQNQCNVSASTLICFLIELVKNPVYVGVSRALLEKISL